MSEQIQIGQIVPTQETRLGRMLAAGRLTATMLSKRTDEHITLTLNSMKKIEDKWEHVALADASHVFIQMGRGGYGSGKVGTYYPSSGKLFFGNPDKAWQYAATQTLKAAVSGTQETECYTLTEEERCGKCGLELTDPVSIARGLGPTCARAQTGSVHYRQEAKNLVEDLSPARFVPGTTLTVEQHAIAEEGALGGTIDNKGRNVPRTFEALAASVKR